MTEVRRLGPLVTTGWLEEHLDDPRIRIVEIDEDTTAYGQGHIEGAVSWHWERDLQDPVRRDYVDRARLGDLLSLSGATEEHTLVLYGGNDNWFAAYGYWLLRYRGVDRVALLDGGRRKWEAEGRPLVTGTPDYEPRPYRIRGPGRPGLRAYRDDVLRGLGTTSFIDVRSPQEFTGERLAPDHLPQEQPYVGGHIPGALNIPWGRAAADDGSFRPVDELRELYGAAGVTESDEVIAYCRIGERAAHSWFVLHELLGHTGARNYDGSWTEYGSAVGVPVERGAAVAEAGS